MTKAQPTISSSTSAGPTPTSSNAPAATSSSGAAATKSSSLGPGAIAGIVIGALAIFSLICMLILLCLRRRRRHRSAKPSTTAQRPPYSPEFMGTTPRAFTPGPGTVAPTGERIPEVQHVNSSVSGPMWAPDFGESHRTDFLLRRGSGQTGFEQQNQPAWSTGGVPPAGTRAASPQRPENTRAGPSYRDRSNDRSNPSDRVPFTDPYTPNPDTQDQSQAPRHPPRSRLTPLFQTPLRLGLATQADGVTPQPTRKSPPKRPRRSDEPRLSIAQALNLKSLKHKPSGTFIAGRKAPTPADDTQRRPLVRNDSFSSFDHDDNHNHDDCHNRNANPLTRSSSSGTAFSDTSSTHTHPARNPRHDSHGSSETISVLMPPPAVFESPPPPQSARKATEPSTPESYGRRPPPRNLRQERPETSFEELLREAGWRTSAWRG
ncbi:MAG: hypothetical protein M1828_003753 [Chrysothrix sp. TS-e1954]|nr:MAG: hypothetical protein M1828_003753 [Chrysothrix sp. TS-e1954]